MLSVEFDNLWHFQHFTQSVILKECLIIQSALKCSERTESQFYLYPEDKLFVIHFLTEIKAEFLKELFKRRLPLRNLMFAGCVPSAFEKKTTHQALVTSFSSHRLLCLLDHTKSYQSSFQMWNCSSYCWNHSLNTVFSRIRKKMSEVQRANDQQVLFSLTLYLQSRHQVTLGIPTFAQ